MPILNARGQALTGVGGAGNSPAIDGRVVPEFVGQQAMQFAWWTEALIVGKSSPSDRDAFALVGLDLTTRVLVTLAHGEASQIVAGGGSWQARIGGVLRTSFGDFVGAGVGACDPVDGLSVYVEDFAGDRNLVVVEPDGREVRRIAVLLFADQTLIRLRGGVLVYPTPGFDWQIEDARTGTPIPWTRRRSMQTVCVPVSMPNEGLWLLERDAAGSERLTVRPANSTQGVVVADRMPYRPDAVALGSSIRAAWAIGEGEYPTELKTVDVQIHEATRVDLEAQQPIQVPSSSRRIWRGLTDPKRSDPGNCLQGDKPAGDPRPVIDQASSYPAGFDFRTLDRSQILAWYQPIQETGLDRSIEASAATGRPIALYDDHATFRKTSHEELKAIRNHGVSVVPWVQAYSHGESASVAIARITQSILWLEAHGETEILIWRGLYTGSGVWPIEKVEALQIELDKLIAAHPSIVADIAFARAGKPTGGGIDTHPRLRDYWTRLCAVNSQPPDFFGRVPVVDPPDDDDPIDPPDDPADEEPMPVVDDTKFKEHQKMAATLAQPHYPSGMSFDDIVNACGSAGNHERKSGRNATIKWMVFAGITRTFEERQAMTWPVITKNGSVAEAQDELGDRCDALDKSEGLWRG